MLVAYYKSAICQYEVFENTIQLM